MYKKYDINQLFTIKTSFFDNLKYVLNKSWHKTLMSYLKDKIKIWKERYVFDKSQPLFHFVFVEEPKPQKFIIFDEKEKIEIHCTKQILEKIHWLLKDNRKIKQQLKWTKKIDQLLKEEFKKWTFDSINWKPYIVYDIETTAMTKDLKETKFYLAYAYIVINWKGKYKYIDNTNLESFVQFMLDFDGYIIWYNNIAFDNPVIVYNCKNWKEERIQNLNQKSIDLFLFLRHKTWKRLWLNAVATSLIGISKTLSSWAEWDVLMRKYQETWEEKYLEEFKKYCKNDVQMTVLTLFYLLYYQKLYFDWQDLKFDLEELIRLGSLPKEEKVSQDTQASIF